MDRIPAAVARGGNGRWVGLSNFSQVLLKLRCRVAFQPRGVFADHDIAFNHAVVNDSAKGGDLDLFLELPEAVDNPAMLAAKLSAKVSRRMNGRKVDVLISAPNLKTLPIHEVAHREGKLL